MTDYSEIKVSVERGRAYLTLNRPEQLNAMTPVTYREINQALLACDEDPSVHVIVIRGAGRAFCSGHDLGGADQPGLGEGGKSGPLTIDEDARRLERSSALLMAVFDIHTPVISQIHGYCLAAGTGLALLSDIVICADDATIGFPPARNMGTLPINLWLYHIGPQWSKRLLLTGDTITGREAASLGWALKSVPANMLEAEVEGLCDRLAAIDPELLAANKRVINLGLELMGMRTLQRVAAETDARAHQAQAADAFRKEVAASGLKAALRSRDEPFGDGRARVHGPEVRDERGFLVQENDVIGTSEA